MVFKECFVLSTLLIEGVLPIVFGLYSWGQFYFGAKSAEATIERLFTLIAESFIPWWFNPISLIIVVILTLCLYLGYLILTSSSS